MIGLEVDLHMHSRHSQDSLTRPERIVERALLLGLGAIVVTDHNSWEGARAATRIARGRLIVIPGAEIKTAKGDLLALFVDEEIDTRDWRSAIDEIRTKGGISIVPHPADSPKLSREDVALADGVEAFNSTCSPRSNALAASLVQDLGKPGFGSSDAHMSIEIGNGRTRVDDCANLAELREHILKSPTVSRTVQSNRFVHFMNSTMCFGLKGIWRL